MLNYVGIDLGGTKIHGGKFGEKGKMLAESRVPTPKNGRDFVISELVELINNLKDAHTAAVGICLPGQIDSKRGVVSDLPNLHGWEQTPIIQILKERVDLPIAIENDARCFLLAEAGFGAARNIKFAAGLNLGTGIGGAIMVDGKIYCGKDCIAGEFGHMVIDPLGPLCHCGSRGCFEQFTSGTAIETHYRSLTNEILDAKKIFQKAQNGNKTAMEAVDTAGKYLGIGLSNIINTVNPEVIVIGGSVGNSLDLLMVKAKGEIPFRALKPGRNTKIVKAELENPGALGAALHAQNK